MVLVVFLLAYLVRRKLDAVSAWSSEALWRSAFKRGSAGVSGNDAGTGIPVDGVVDGGTGLACSPGGLQSILGEGRHAVRVASRYG